jgi:REP element-mobilizing transposase RayT
MRGMKRPKRWLAPWKDSRERPVVYHCISRVVERRLAFGPDEKEKLRTFLRMQENFSGCRVLAYCFMSNHIHLLLEVPPMAEGGLSDAELLERLRALYSAAFVAEIAKELADARQSAADGLAGEELALRIHERFTYRMHDLGEFMKTFLQRFTRWFNARNDRTGVLWEARFKSVLVEEGIAAKTMAAYIDLNPVRAGIVSDPAEYRWSSYGEAMGGGPRGHGKKAREGLARALLAHKGGEADAGLWTSRISREYRMLLLAAGGERVEETVTPSGERKRNVIRKGMNQREARAELAGLDGGGNVALGKLLLLRVRYFSDGAVIGSRDFVDEVFRRSRERFGPKRRDGARKLRGCGTSAAIPLWSARDLRKGTGPPLA